MVESKDNLLYLQKFSKKEQLTQFEVLLGRLFNGILIRDSVEVITMPYMANPVATGAKIRAKVLHRSGNFKKDLGIIQSFAFEPTAKSNGRMVFLLE